MKIAVYAICKNEEKNISEFIKSTKDADEIVIGDTGSNDSSKELLKSTKAKLFSISISPWRFDDARNSVLSLVSNDIDVCISLDLDERLVHNWRTIVESNFTNTTTKLKYIYDWGSGVRFKIDKIHSRHGYRWKYPCHEILVPDTRLKEKISLVGETLVQHYPDPGKSRSSYLELLKCGADENPEDPRSSFYLGRELFFQKKYIDAIKEFNRYISLPSTKWNAEIAYAHRLSARCELELGNLFNALTSIEEGVKIAPERRESWFYLALIHYKLENWNVCYESTKKALSISEHEYSWPIESAAWNHEIYDYAAVSAYYIGKTEEAILLGEKAKSLNPNDQRLRSNLNLYLTKRGLYEGS